MKARTCGSALKHRKSIASMFFSRDLQTNNPRPQNCADTSRRYDHCLAEAGPGHLLRASRSAITSASPVRRCPQRPPSQPALYAPTQAPPWLQKGQKDTRKRAQSPARVPAPNRGRGSREGHRKPAPDQQKAHASPPTLLCSSPRPCFPFPFPHHPGTPCPFQHPSAVITPPG